MDMQLLSLALLIQSSYLSRNIGNESTSLKYISPIVSLSILLFVLHVSLLFLNFKVGFIVTSILMQLIIFYFRNRGNKRFFGDSNKLGYKENLKLLCVVSMLIILLYPAISNFDFYDKLSDIGHFSTTNSIINGNYPPLNIVNPDEPFYYHYGVDLLAAIVSLSFDIPPHMTFKLLTAISIFYSGYAISAAIISSFKFNNGIIIIPIIIVFGSGVPFILDNTSSYYSLGPGMPPHIVANFFQAPWLYAYPALMATLIICYERDRLNTRSIYLYLFPVFAVLSFTQEIVALVLSGSLFGAAGICMIIKYMQDTLKKVEIVLPVTLFFLTLILVMIGPVGQGLLAYKSNSYGTIEFKNLFINSNLIDIGIWNLSFYGLLLLTGSIGMVCLRGYQAVFCTLLISIGGCILIHNTLEYTESWDMMKFASIALSLLTFSSLAFFSKLEKTKFNIISFLITPCITVGGLLFSYSFWDLNENEHEYVWHITLEKNNRFENRDRIDEIANYLRNMNISSPIYSNERIAEKLSVLYGLPIFNPKAIFAELFVSDTVLKDRLKILNNIVSIHDLNSLGVEFIIMDKSDEKHKIIGIDQIEKVISTEYYELLKIPKN
nr:hypothetical protein [Vibrio mimicus]